MVWTIPQEAQCRWKRKPAFLITPNTDWGQCSSTQYPAGDQPGKVALAFCLSSNSIVACALVLSLGGTISLEADKASSCWSKCSGLIWWSSSLYYTYAAGTALGERRGGILLLYVLKISSKKHKLETSSFKEISEIAYLAHPSRQPRYQMLGTHTGELWSCSGENVYFITALRADVMSQSLGRATLGKV